MCYYRAGFNTPHCEDNAMSSAQAPQDCFVSANGLQLHYLDWGNSIAPPLLLLHGFTSHAHTWDAFAQATCARFHVLALDQRGHGDSEWAKDGAYRVDDHAADIAAFHEHLGLPPVLLVGLSMGGRNAIAFTAQYPQKVKKLVIVDIGPDIAPQGAERVRRMAGEAPEEFASPDDAIAYLKQFLTHPAAEAALRQRVTHGLKRLPTGKYAWKYDVFLRQQRRQGTMPAVDLWPAVQQIRVPTLIVRGGDSDIFTPETARRMQSYIPGSQVVEIPGAGHSVPADAPAAFAETVQTFLTT
jgi:pimeloyl-ACP methyl ester carboxylesterase